MRRFLGLRREPVYSPGKVEDDRAILEEVAARLAERHPVEVRDVEPDLSLPPPGTVVFTMCQGPVGLALLRTWQAAGVRVVNTPDAIEACHRTRMVPALARHGVLQPESLLVSTDSPCTLPDWVNESVWVKRGDVHATCTDDVVRVDPSQIPEVLDGFRCRGVRVAVLQRHVDGPVLKFYAVRGGFFRCYAADGAEVTGEGAALLHAAAEQGAAALGLEVYGGDGILAVDGSVPLVDLNDWPSYGRCCGAAASAIATYLEEQSG